MKLDKKTHISVFITNDAEMKKLNKDHLGRDYPTDVLSFEIKEKLEDGSLYLGDIVVNKDQAKRQCKEYGNDLEEEISELVGHGVLHLLGIHHDGDGKPLKKDSSKSTDKIENDLIKKSSKSLKNSVKRK
ncbi:MAG TPA: rRNA maturation RNase YbeY [bacterium]|nr:rRNA maturation RNase YbeY [bacterium]